MTAYREGLAAGAPLVLPTGLVVLRDAMPGWDGLLDGLHAAADRSAPLGATPVRPA